MSLQAPIAYFRTILNSLGHKEWKDAFSDDNIPSTVLDRMYHLLLGEASSIKQNQDMIELTAPMAIKLYVKGYKDPVDGRDKAAAYFDNILKNALAADNRVTQTNGIKNITFVGGGLSELDVDNDNIIKVTMNFNCFITMATA